MSAAVPGSRQIERVVLTGFMGSGKTTVGRVLANRLGWHFQDLDAAVASREGLTVPQIFAQRGEAAFRMAESETLAGLLAQSKLIIALGGGAPETVAVRDLLVAARGTYVVHLHAPFDLLYARCLAQAQDPAATERPLLGERKAAAERFERRMTVYASVAHGTADASEESPLKVADAILVALRAQHEPNEDSRRLSAMHHKEIHHGSQ